MWYWTTADADVRCDHKLGRVSVVAAEDLVFVAGRPVIVDDEPRGRPVHGCPNVGVGIKPCTTTVTVGVGKSPFVHILGRPVVRADLDGLTDGTPQGVVHYTVQDPGQTLVTEAP